MADVDRWSARLSRLSHTQLLQLAAAGCSASAGVARVANEWLAADQPKWIDVLLCIDLVPHFFASLELSDAACAGRVCSVWRDFVRHKLRRDRKLHLLPTTELGAARPSLNSAAAGDLLFMSGVFNMNGLFNNSAWVLDRNMAVVNTIPDASRVLGTTHDKLFCYSSSDANGPAVTAYSIPEVVSQATVIIKGFDTLNAGAIGSGWLFVCGELAEEEWEEVEGLEYVLSNAICRLQADNLDRTLEWTLEFEPSAALAVQNEALYVGNQDVRGTSVFTLDGDPLRTFQLPDLGIPNSIVFREDRLYVATDERQIFVLSAVRPHLVLQVVDLADEVSGKRLWPERITGLFGLCFFGERLLVSRLTPNSAAFSSLRERQPQLYALEESGEAQRPRNQFLADVQEANGDEEDVVAASRRKRTRGLEHSDDSDS